MLHFVTPNLLQSPMRLAVALLVLTGCQPTGTTTTPESEPATDAPVTANPQSSSASPQPATAPSPAPDQPANKTVADAIRERLPPLQSCYKDALAARPGLTGHHVYTIEINPSGTLTTVTIDDDTLQSNEVSVCARAKIAMWTFPPMKEAGSVTFTVVYAPR